MKSADDDFPQSRRNTTLVKTNNENDNPRQYSIENGEKINKVIHFETIIFVCHITRLSEFIEKANHPTFFLGQFSQ